MLRRARGTAVCVLVLAAWSLPSPATACPPAGPPQLFGVAEPHAWRTNPPRASPDDVSARIHELGGTSHRFPVYWRSSEPRGPQNGVHSYDLGAYDEIYRTDMARGIRPLLVVLGSPPWSWDLGALAGGTGGQVFNPPSRDHYGDWRAFIGELVRRYPAAVGVEVWNEPNLAAFWGNGNPLVPLDPARYVELLREAHAAVKAVDPAMPVLGGSSANVGVTTPGKDMRNADFLRAIYADGAAQAMDGLAIHPYPKAPRENRFQTGIDEARAARDSVGASTPLWITEVGVSTTGPPWESVSEAQQAEILVDIFNRARAMPDVRALYVHTLTEPVDNPGDDEMGYALVRGHGVGSGFPGKPAFFKLRGAVRVKAGSAKATVRRRLSKGVRNAERGLRRGRVSRLRRRSKFTFAVQLPGPGTVRVELLSTSRSRVAYADTAYRRAAHTRKQVRLTRAGRRAMRPAHALTLKLRARFTDVAKSCTTILRTVKLKAAKRER